MKATPFLTLLISVWLTIAGQTQVQSLKNQLEEIVRSSGFKGSVLVSHADRTLLAVGYGLADHEKGIKNSASTQHRIGSVTKQFTAMAMLILEEQGKLKQNGPANPLVPQQQGDGKAKRPRPQKGPKNADA